MYAEKKIALDNYINNHNRLINAYYDEKGDPKKADIDLKETFVTAKAALENYNENVLIYDEFNYYQDKKKILGVHPVFRVLKLTESITKMREASAVKRYRNLINYINRGNRNLSKTKDAVKRKASEDKIKIWEEERDLINTIKKLDE